MVLGVLLLEPWHAASNRQTALANKTFLLTACILLPIISPRSSKPYRYQNMRYHLGRHVATNLVTVPSEFVSTKISNAIFAIVFPVVNSFATRQSTSSRDCILIRNFINVLQCDVDQLSYRANDGATSQTSRRQCGSEVILTRSSSRTCSRFKCDKQFVHNVT
jgi:hypothetical protein